MGRPTKESVATVWKGSNSVRASAGEPVKMGDRDKELNFLSGRGGGAEKPTTGGGEGYSGHGCEVWSKIRGAWEVEIYFEI